MLVSLYHCGFATQLLGSNSRIPLSRQSCRSCYPVNSRFLSAADECDHFHAIAGLQNRVAVLRTGNNFKIHFDRNMRLSDAQVAEQAGHRTPGGNLAGLSVDLDVHPLTHCGAGAC